MAQTPTDKMTLRESLMFFAKLATYLAGLALFGFLIFLLTKSLHLHR